MSDELLLRAIRCARIYLAAGDALETVIFRLANGNFGRVSASFSAVLKQMRNGEVGAEALTPYLNRAQKKKRERGLALMLGALAAEGQNVDVRLEQAAEEIAAMTRDRSRLHAKRVSGLSKLTLILLSLSILPPVVNFLNQALRGSELPWAQFYAGEAILFLIFVVLMGSSE